MNPATIRDICAAVIGSMAALGVAAAVAKETTPTKMPVEAKHLDGSDGRDWAGYGRTFGEQHYSPLAEIDQTTIARLGLAWSLDLGPENFATEPLAVDGTLYFATGYSLVMPWMRPVASYCGVTILMPR